MAASEIHRDETLNRGDGRDPSLRRLGFVASIDKTLGLMLCVVRAWANAQPRFARLLCALAAARRLQRRATDGTKAECPVQEKRRLADTLRDLKARALNTS